MKLKDTFITHMTGGEQILIDVEGTNFNGLARSNKTAGFIIDCLKTETTKEAIIKAMCDKYDAPQEVISSDVDKIIEKLRSINAICE